MKASICELHHQHDVSGTDGFLRRASESSILAIQIFDQKKFKKKDQGFLGVINVPIGSVIDLDSSADGMIHNYIKNPCIDMLLTF